MRLIEFEYSPGYCDMRGAYFSERLAKNDADEWVVVTRARQHHGAPTVVSTFAALPDAVEAFDEYLASSGVLTLAERKKSKMFVTDYSPWSFRVLMNGAPDARQKRTYVNISQYKEYSPKDLLLIEELKQRFRALRGELIREIEEPND